MLNLHPPFRQATESDLDAASKLARRFVSAAGTVVAEEDGRIVAVLAGRSARETWNVRVLAVKTERAGELGPRLLAVADALAADDGLGSVTLDPEWLDPPVRALLDQEGFRRSPSGLMMVRKVVPQG